MTQTYNFELFLFYYIICTFGNIKFYFEQIIMGSEMTELIIFEVLNLLI